MKRKFGYLQALGLLVWSSLLFVSNVVPVLAQSGTPPPPGATVTAIPGFTPHPLFPTSTPLPTRDLTCPDSLPVGYGEATPSASWRIQCGKCVTNILKTLTPAPTSRWRWTPTPGGAVDPPPVTEITGTVTLTPTPEPTRPITYWLSDMAAGVSLQLVTNQNNVYASDVLMPSPIEVAWWAPHPLSQTVMGYLVWNTSQRVSSDIYQYVEPVVTGTHAVSVEQSLQRNGWTLLQPSQDNGAAKNAINAIYGYTVTQVYQVQSVVLNPITYSVHIGFRNRSSVGYDNYAAYRVYYVMYGEQPGAQPVPTATPAVTATPSPTAWVADESKPCTYIPEALQHSNPAEGMFEMPIVSVISHDCPVAFPETVIPMSYIPGLGLGDVVIPHVNVCIDGVTFGTLMLFGRAVDLDLLASMMAGVTGLFIIIRS